MPQVKYQNRSGGSGLVPEGKIALQVVEDDKTCDGITSNGNEKIDMKMKVRGKYDEVNQTWVPAEGGYLFESLYFTENAAWRIDCFLNSAGKAPEEGTIVELNAEKTVGCVVYCEVVHEEYENRDGDKKTKAVIASYIKVESPIHPKHKKEEPVAIPVEVIPESAPFGSNDDVNTDDVPF